MTDTLKMLQSALISDSSLMAMLADNPPFFDKSGETAPENSIMPVNSARGDLKTPFISIQQGVQTQTGYKLQEETFYVRVYNNRNKAYYEIDQIAEKVISILHRTRIALDSHTNVILKYESTLADQTDEGFDLNFRELHFRIYLL